MTIPPTQLSATELERHIRTLKGAKSILEYWRPHLYAGATLDAAAAQAQDALDALKPRRKKVTA